MLPKFRKETDNTIMKGELTLFIEDLTDIDSINTMLKGWEERHDPVVHIHFGSEGSFNPDEDESWDKWTAVILNLLKRGFWVSLEVKPTDLIALHEYGYCEQHRFIPIIILGIPYINLMNYNTAVKISSEEFNANPGTWTNHLSDLTKHENFTPTP